MHNTRPLTLVASMCLSLALVAVSSLAAPARADDPALEALRDLMSYADQVYFQPNGLDYGTVESTYPSDMAIVMGMVLRTQYPHAVDDIRENALNTLADNCREYLDLMSRNSPGPYDGWGNPTDFETLNQYFEIAATTTDYDSYSKSTFHVDPNNLHHRDLLASIAASGGGGSQVGPGAGIYEPRDDGDSVVLLDQQAGPVADPDVQGDMNVPPAPPTPDYGKITDNDILGRWVSEQTGEAISFQAEGQHKIVGRFENTAHVDYGPGYENMTYNWQPASITLQLTEAFDMEWGLQFKGRFCGSGGCENLVVELWHEKDGRIAMAYDGFVLEDGPFFK